ncbi:MAG: methyltransferase domain-containing protein [Lactobacillus sp.]|nr:methyltransferase domain-containing protein [Lactobacillus sp.]
MHWDAEEYDHDHGFVAKYGENLLQFVPDCNAILDIGSGTGELTRLLTHKATFVRGIDSSWEMVKQAKLQFPQLDVMQANILTYEDAHRYDVVFSNAVFHWIPPKDQNLLLAQITKLMQPNGLLIAEFGGAYNIEYICDAFKHSLAHYGLRSSLNFFFPHAKPYQELLEQHGFEVKRLSHYYRPTQLADGHHGLANWLRQFFATDLDPLPEVVQKAIIDNTYAQLAPILWKDGYWQADYWRMQVVAQLTTPSDFTDF